MTHPGTRPSPQLPAAFDPFIYAVGRVAVMWPWFEAKVGLLYATLADRREAMSEIRGASYNDMRPRILREVARYDEERQRRVSKMLTDSDELSRARRLVMHGIWVTNAEGYHTIKPGQGKRASQYGSGTPDSVNQLADLLEEVGHAVSGEALKLVNERRAERGLQPQQGIAWQIDG